MKTKIMELKKYKIGDVLELQRGYDLPSSQMVDGNVLVAGSNGIIGTHNVARGNTPCITVGRSGSVGKVHFYEQPVWAHNTSLFVKNFKANDPKYLFYFLRNLHLDEIFGKSSSVVPSLDRKVVHAMTVPFQDDVDKQKDIAHTLSLLDEKIALNRAVNYHLSPSTKRHLIIMGRIGSCTRLLVESTKRTRHPIPIRFLNNAPQESGGGLSYGHP